MTEEKKPTEEKKMSLRDTIVPKSDQINYDDVANGAKRRVKVLSLKRGSSDEQPLRIAIEDATTGEKMRDYVPSKSMRRVLIGCWGDAPAPWIGRVIEVFGNPAVKWAGEAIGGIEISAVSGITKPVTLALTTTRGKRKQVTIQVIA
jgi:hypothetical protein